MNLTTTHRAFSMSRGLLLAAVALALIFLAIPSLRASDRWETLEAIHWIENPHNSSRPGAYGELGAYQFRETTWRMHTSVPFRKALDRSASDRVAVQHYEYLKQGLVRNGLEPTTYNIALAWNGGLSAAINHSVPAAARDYAERVTNIAQSLHKTQLASNP
jgi:hypothetical protein